MRKILFAALWLIGFIACASATCTVTVPAGAIETVYCNAESVTFASPYATLTDAVGSQLGVWAEAYWQVSSANAFGAWFDNYITWSKTQMQQSLTVPAATPVITPAQ